MYNSDIPSRAELPTSKQLVRSTLLAAVSALVLLVAVVLPSEYGIDPTGIGRVLHLTEMGGIKQQLAAEATADAIGSQATAQVEPAKVETLKLEWRDEMSVSLKPGQGTEIKLKMAEGAKATYFWEVHSGVVNFDTHGDAPGKSISYEKGRGVPSAEGVLEAAFTGNHGWYWRNRGTSDVTLILRTRGDYTDIKKVI